MAGIAVTIAIIFIGGYFYKSASNIGKNGFLWLGFALGAFLVTSIFSGLILQYFMDGVLAVFVGMFCGVLSLSGVNHYMNIIHD